MQNNLRKEMLETDSSDIATSDCGWTTINEAAPDRMHPAKENT